MKRLASIATLALLAGCAGPKVSDTVKEVPCGNPMSLPNGYEMTYDLVDVTDPANEILMYDDVEFTCFLEKSVGGKAAAYCGFIVEVYDTYFSFDAVPSSWDGDDIDGIGNDEGATITDYTADGYVLEYRITHTSEF